MNTLLKSVFLLAALSLLATGAVHAKEESKTAASATGSSTAAAKDGKSKAGDLIDLNSASEEELATLPKIGEARAKAIVKGRPYRGKDELVEKKIISQDVYDGIKDRIVARQKPGGSEKKSDKGGDGKQSDDKKTSDKK